MKIQCKGVDFSYEKQPLLPLISGLNLDIGSGESVWIQGRSGTGKSSFLRLVAGLQRPQKGIISVDSRSFSELDEASLRKFRLENIGYLHQENHLIDHWTVLQNLELTSQKKDLAETLPELLSGLGLKKEILRHTASTLSGGERQRIGLARVLLQTPKILLLDEPTSHLDDESAKAAMSLVQRCLPNSTTLVVSHDLRMKNYNFRPFHFGEIQK